MTETTLPPLINLHSADDSYPAFTARQVKEIAEEYGALCYAKARADLLAELAQPTDEMKSAGAGSIIDGIDNRPSVSWSEEAGMAFVAMINVIPKA